MFLKALYLHNFRLYEEALYEFSPGVNIISGPNARGKTSLVEAIYFLITGRSFRTAQSSDLIRYGTPHFHLEAAFVKHGIEQKLRVTYSTTERRITYNATTYPFLSSLLGLLQGVVLHPDDDAIVKGAPAARRQLVDMLLAQSDPLYVHHLTRYDRAMRQRNHLLRAKSHAAIDSWEYEMANAAAYVVVQRSRAANALRIGGEEHYRILSGGSESLGLQYKAHGMGDSPQHAPDILRTLFRDQFRRHRPREMEMGATLTGPHKDDLVITLDDKEVRSFGSDGQQRSCVAALRLAEWAQLQASSQETPLMLIDDIGMSLDSGRRKRLVDHFSSLGQVFVTTTDEAEIVSDAHRHQI